MVDRDPQDREGMYFDGSDKLGEDKKVEKLTGKERVGLILAVILLVMCLILAIALFVDGLHYLLTGSFFVWR